MIRNELTRIRPVATLDLVIGLAVMLAMAAGAYFLDSARIAAFGIVPAITVISFAGKAGITLKKTPVLFVGCVLIALSFYAGATWYVWLNPRLG